MRDAFIKALIELAKRDNNVELITGDLGFGVLKPYWDCLPNQFTNVGIAEQNMTSVAAGMALEGKTVFTYSIGNFPTLRCLEQIRNDCAYHDANVKIICVGGGFAYGALGMSHHATEDIAIMRSLPNIVVMAPADITETIEATKAIYQYKGTCYLRLGRGGEKQFHTYIENFNIGKALQIKKGDNVALFSTGAIIDEVIKADEILTENGINSSIYTFPTIKPIDEDCIIKCSKKHALIVTVEEHNVIGGFGSAVAEIVSELNGKKAIMLKIGINDVYSSMVGSQLYLRSYYGIDAKAIAEKTISIMKNLNNK